MRLRVGSMIVFALWPPLPITNEPLPRYYHISGRVGSLIVGGGQTIHAIVTLTIRYIKVCVCVCAVHYVLLPSPGSKNVTGCKIFKSKSFYSSINGKKKVLIFTSLDYFDCC